MMTTDTDEALVRVDAIVGRAADDGWPGRLESARVDVLRLDQAEAQKSRLRKMTEAGVEVAISLDRGLQLRDGDILAWDEARTAPGRVKPADDAHPNSDRHRNCQKADAQIRLQ